MQINQKRKRIAAPEEWAGCKHSRVDSINLIKQRPMRKKKQDRLSRYLSLAGFLMFAASSIRYKKIKTINQNFLRQKVVLNNNQCLLTPCSLLKIRKTRFKQPDSPSIIQLYIYQNRNSIFSHRCNIKTLMMAILMEIWVERITI